VLLVVTTLVLTAGCSDPVQVGAEPTVSVAGGPDAELTDERSRGTDSTSADGSVAVEHANESYRATVTLALRADVNYTYPDLRVVGLGPEGEQVCAAAFGDVAADAGRVSETVACERVPMAFVTESDRETPGPDGPDVVVDHETLVLADANASSLTYEVLEPDPVTGSPPAGPVAYAKCVQRRDGADPAAFVGSSPWLDWERSDPVVRRSSGIAAANRTGHAVSADPARGPVFEEAVALPSDAALDPVRALLDRAAAEPGTRAPDGVALDTGPNLTRAQLVAVFDALHDREVTELADVPVANVSTGRGAPGGGPNYSAGIRWDDRRISCYTRDRGGYTGADGLTVTYAIEYRGGLFEVVAGATVRWTGPAFNATGG
jgi:hypothetical protein